jgi:hypothetical protein
MHDGVFGGNDIIGVGLEYQNSGFLLGMVYHIVGCSAWQLF